MRDESGKFSHLQNYSYYLPLPRFERGLSGLSFAYSRVGVQCPICSKMATDLK